MVQFEGSRGRSGTGWFPCQRGGLIHLKSGQHPFSGLGCAPCLPGSLSEKRQATGAQVSSRRECDESHSRGLGLLGSRLVVFMAFTDATDSNSGREGVKRKSSREAG